MRVSPGEAREVVREATRRIVPDVQEVRFGEPVLELVDGRPYLLLRGERSDGNCALAFVRLASTASGPAGAVTEARTAEEQGVALYPTTAGSCTGAPCARCVFSAGEHGET